MHRVHVLLRRTAHETLALPAGHRHGQSRRLVGGLAQSEHNLRNPTSQVAAQVEARAPGEVFELDAAQLVERFILGELAGLEPAEDVLHSPANTSRMCCQWVPAQ